MGLSSFLNPDILIGMGRARQKERDNILTQEADRRKSGTGLLKTIYEHPDLTPEARDIVLRKLATASSLEPGKPDPKGLFSLDDVLNVRPQVGKSVQSTQSFETPNAGPNQFGLSPVDIGSLPPMRAPEAPADYRRSGFYSPEERSRQSEDTYRRQQGIQSEELIKRRRAELEAEAELAPLKPPAPKGYSASGGVVLNQDTGDFTPIQQPDKPPPSPPASVGEYNFYVEQEKAAGRTPLSFDAYQERDANRRRIQPSATIQINQASQARGIDTSTSDALNRATMNMQPGRRLQVFNTVNQMAERGDVAKVRETIRQAAAESEPVAVQSAIRGRREVIKSLNDIRELLKPIPQNLLVGTVEDVIRKLGSTTDKRYVQIANRLRVLNQSYRRSMTGAQFSIPEAAEYAQIFPSYSNTAPVNAQLIDSLIEAFGANDAVFWDSKLGPGWSDALSPLTPPSGGQSQSQPQRERVQYQGKNYFLVGTDANGDAILEPAP